MGGETGQLQRLTDEQVSARLAAYKGDGSLERGLQLLRDKAADLISAEVLATFGPERAARYTELHNGSADAQWVQGIAEYGRQIYRDGTPVPGYIAARTDTASRITAKMVERFADDSDLLQECISAFVRISSFENEDRKSVV